MAILCATGAAADPYCAPDATEKAALPAALSGDWVGEMVQGMVVVNGGPRALPANPAPLPAKISAMGDGISLADAAKPAAYALLPATGDTDFALPGESPLGAGEFLGPLLAEAGITCPALDLPQFRGALPMGQVMTGEALLFALSETELLMVFLFAETSEPAKNGVRAVLRYRR